MFWNTNNGTTLNGTNTWLHWRCFHFNTIQDSCKSDLLDRFFTVLKVMTGLNRTNIVVFHHLYHKFSSNTTHLPVSLLTTQVSERAIPIKTVSIIRAPASLTAADLNSRSHIRYDDPTIPTW